MTGKVWICVAVLALSGCDGAAEDTKVPGTEVAGGPVLAENYAGDVTFRIAESFAARGKDIPLTFYVGFAPETETRLGANAFVDLRELQGALPDLLSGEFAPECGLDLDMVFGGAEAEGEYVHARGAVKATLYRCRDKGTETEARGIRLLSETIDFDAVVRASILQDCVEIRLVSLDLSPRGLVGRLGTLFGLTERTRATLLSEANNTFSENPICPDLPEALALLEPHYGDGGFREIGEGGIGAALSGSIGTSAETLVELLALAQQRGIVPGEGPKPSALDSSAALRIRIEDTLAGPKTEVPYGVDLGLAAVAPTRIGVQAMLDLRDMQRSLPDLAAGAVLLDSCGGRIAVQRLEAEARESSIGVNGRLNVETFNCLQTDPGTWQRGERLSEEEVDVRAEMSARLEENCIVFTLLEITRDPPLPIAQVDTGSGRIQAARALLMEAVGLLLEERPFCPEAPPELAFLDPRLEHGSPHEIGDGGVGVAINGSIDMSTKTIVELLRIMQERGASPPSP